MNAASLPFRRILFCLPALVLSLNVFAESPKEQDPIVGRWRWIGNQIVTCNADNTFSCTPTNRKGRWSTVPSDALERKYAFTWDEGLYVDQVTLSHDRKSLKGKNQGGLKISATKIEQP